MRPGKGRENGGRNGGQVIVTAVIEKICLISMQQGGADLRIRYAALSCWRPIDTWATLISMPRHPIDKGTEQVQVTNCAIRNRNRQLRDLRAGQADNQRARCDVELVKWVSPGSIGFIPLETSIPRSISKASGSSATPITAGIG